MDWTAVGDWEVVLHGQQHDYLFFCNYQGGKYTFHTVTVGPGNGLFFQFMCEVHRFEMWGNDNYVFKFFEGLVNMMIDGVVDLENPDQLYNLVGGWLREEQPRMPEPPQVALH